MRSKFFRVVSRVIKGVALRLAILRNSLKSNFFRVVNRVIEVPHAKDTEARQRAMQKSSAKQ